MACSLFGKLPSKRDFVAIRAPRRFLTVWENWVQAGLASSREQLGNGWQEAYLSAPIWRFWLGRHLAGRPVLGALMPSVDGIGRYFPVCALGAFDAPRPLTQFAEAVVSPGISLDELFVRDLRAAGVPRAGAGKSSSIQSPSIFAVRSPLRV